MKHLSTEQQQLAAGCFPLAVWLARRFACAWHLDGDDAESCATHTLVSAAACFDPGRGARFTTYASKAIVRSLQRLVSERRRPLAFTDLADSLGDADGPPDHRRPERADPETEELIERVRSCLPPRWWQLLWRHHAEGETLADLGREEGLSRQRISQLAAKAVKQTRRELCRPGEEV